MKPFTARTALETVVERLAEVDASIKSLKAERDELASHVSERINSKGTHVFGDVSVTMAVNNRVNTSKVEQALSPGQLRRVQSLKVNTALVKELYPSVHQDAVETNGFRVSVRKASK